VAFKSINPHLPSDVVGEFKAAGPEGVEYAVRRAREAFAEWRGQPALVRGGVLSRMADDLEGRAEEVARLVVREVGKPLTEARAEVTRGISILRYYAQLVLAPDGETYPASQSGDWLIARRNPFIVSGEHRRLPTGRFLILPFVNQEVHR